MIMANWEDDWETLRPAPRGGRGRALYLVGRHFGRLKVIERAGSDKNGASLWRCLCTCGNTKVIKRGHLRSGKVKSCGCLLSEYKQQPFKKGLRRGDEVGLEMVTIEAIQTVGFEDGTQLLGGDVRTVPNTEEVRNLIRNGRVQVVHQMRGEPLDQMVHDD